MDARRGIKNKMEIDVTTIVEPHSNCPKSTHGEYLLHTKILFINSDLLLGWVYSATRYVPLGYWLHAAGTCERVAVV